MGAFCRKSKTYNLAIKSIIWFIIAVVYPYDFNYSDFILVLKTSVRH